MPDGVDGTGRTGTGEAFTDARPASSESAGFRGATVAGAVDGGAFSAEEARRSVSNSSREYCPCTECFSIRSIAASIAL